VLQSCGRGLIQGPHPHRVVPLVPAHNRRKFPALGAAVLDTGRRRFARIYHRLGSMAAEKVYD
jgi:hypothetical protein